MKLRKLLVVAVVVVLCMAISAVGFAAPSPTGGSVSATDANGNPVQVTVAEVSNAAQLKGEIDASKAPGTLAWLQDVSIEGYEGGAVTLTLAVNGVKAGDEVTVIHYVNGAWEYVKPDSVSDGQVVVTLSSLSPVGVVVKQADGAGAATTDATSPKTGSADLAMILTIIAIAAASTVFFAGKQLRKSER